MNALIMVDLQNDFCPGGALPVPGGDEIIPLINRLQGQFDLVAATQDWHPANHLSFASQHGKRPGETILLNGYPQILWPDHCIQGTHGSDFYPVLDRKRIAAVFHKGVDREADSYSAFFDNRKLKSTGLLEYLRKAGAGGIYIAGLATDYCVKYTALDALELGLKVWVVRDAVRGIDVSPGDSRKSLDDLKRQGASLIDSGDLFRVE